MIRKLLLILPKLGCRNVAYIGWYQLSMKLGWSKKKFPLGAPITGTFFKATAPIKDYPESWRTKTLEKTNRSFSREKGTIGIIGAGNFASAMILPSLKKCSAVVKYIASSGGLSGTTLAKKLSISNSTTDYTSILKDESVDLVLVTKRHNLHAKMVAEVLEADKHVL